MSQGLLLSDVVSNLLGALVAELGHVASLLRVADASEEVCDLVGVLAGCRNFDGASPVEVEVAERVCQLLQLVLSKRRLVQWHVEVSRQNAALVGT